MQLGTGRAIGCCRGVCGGLEITGCTRYRGHRADIVVYNCWPPLPYHHLHFSGPSSSLSHPLHYPGDPYYVNSVASEMCVRSADKSSGCWLLLGPPHSWSWRDRSGPCGLWMRRPFRCEAGRLVLTYLDYLYCRRSEGQTCAWVVFIWLGIYCVDSRLVQYMGTMLR